MGKINIKRKVKVKLQPKLVDIDFGIRKIIKRKFNNLINTSRNMIIISKDVNGINRGFSTFSDNDTVYLLEKIKLVYLTNNV